jgi:hypothetical protein
VTIPRDRDLVSRAQAQGCRSAVQVRCEHATWSFSNPLPASRLRRRRAFHGQGEAIAIRIISSDAAKATQEAASLRRQILDADLDGVHVDLVKEDKSTQDGGATLLVLMSAPVVTALAQGIADWIRRRRIESNLELEIDGVKIKMSGDVADDPAKVRQLITGLRKKKRGA